MIRNSIARTCTSAVVAAPLLVIGSIAQSAPETYTFDKGHTEIIFSYNHLGNSIAYAQFKDYDGTVVIDQENPENSKVSVTIKADSFDSGVAEFDKHAKSADFFDVEKYPEIKFESTSIKQVSNNGLKITGNLTIKDKTHPVTLDATLNYIGDHQLGKFIEFYKDKNVAGLSAKASVLRSDFDVGKHAPLVSDKVNVIIETELFRK